MSEVFGTTFTTLCVIIFGDTYIPYTFSKIYGMGGIISVRLGVTLFWNIYIRDTVLEVTRQSERTCTCLSVTSLRDTHIPYTISETM